MIQKPAAPSLPGALELEALITLKGDNPSADDLVRNRLGSVRLLALGRPDQWGLAHLLHCTVPVGPSVIPMLPVFTRLEHVIAAVQMNPTWQTLQIVEVEGAAILADLEAHEWLGINPWSGREFKLPATVAA